VALQTVNGRQPRQASGSSQDWNDFAAHVPGGYDQYPNSDWQSEPSRSRAAGIEVEHTTTHLLLRDVTVPGDHNFEARCFRFQTKLSQVVQDVDGDASEFDNFSFRQSARPRLFVDVPADACDRRNCREFVENFGSAYVSSVNDVLGSTECVDRFRTKQAMRVGYDADDDGIAQFSVPDFRLAIISLFISA
jgi:hypothetical protein